MGVFFFLHHFPAHIITHSGCGFEYQLSFHVKSQRWRVQRRSPTRKCDWACSFVRRVQHIRSSPSSVFPSSLFLRRLCSIKDMSNTQVVSTETQRKMLIVFIITAENIRERSCWESWKKHTSKAGLDVQSAVCEVASRFGRQRDPFCQQISLYCC